MNRVIQPKVKIKVKSQSHASAGRNFQCYHWEGCVGSMQCNVEFGYQLSICSGTEENHGKPWSSWPVVGPSGCKLTSGQQSGSPRTLTLVPNLCCCVFLFLIFFTTRCLASALTSQRTRLPTLYCCKSDCYADYQTANFAHSHCSVLACTVVQQLVYISQYPYENLVSLVYIFHEAFHGFCLNLDSEIFTDSHLITYVLNWALYIWVGTGVVLCLHHARRLHTHRSSS
jgi:hypothetical protein